MDIIITPPVSPILLSFNNISIRYYGVIMAFAFVIGVILSYKLFKNKSHLKDAEIFLDYSPMIILFSIIGARLFYVIALHEFYLNNPLEIILINHGGLSLFGAIFFGIVSLYLFSRIKKFDFLLHIDTIAVAFPLCQSIGRFGNFFNQEAYGTPTDGILKLFVAQEYRTSKFIDIEYYHPTFLYESILDFIIFVILLILYNKNKINGSIACYYLILYSIVRFIIEGIRIDSVCNIGTIPIVRLICIFVFVFTLICLVLINKKAPEQTGA